MLDGLRVLMLCSTATVGPSRRTQSSDLAYGVEESFNPGIYDVAGIVCTRVYTLYSDRGASQKVLPLVFFGCENCCLNVD